MKLVMNSDVKEVERNTHILRDFIREKFRFEDRAMMENVFLTREYAPLVKQIIEDHKRTPEEKVHLLMKRMFKRQSLTIVQGAMGEGKGTTSSSIIEYAKANGYFEKYGIEGVVAFAPCPDLWFIDHFIWDISQIEEYPNHVFYCPELALVFGNTTQDYAKNESTQVPKSVLKLRQVGARFIGESQNDSLVNITLFKFAGADIFRNNGAKAMKFSREQTSDRFEGLLKYLAPPSAVDDDMNPILDNLTKIVYIDDKGFISLRVPRTEKYTKENSEAFRDIFSLVEDLFIKAIKEDGEDFLKMKNKLSARGIERTPKFWKDWCLKNGIEMDLTKQQEKTL